MAATFPIEVCCAFERRFVTRTVSVADGSTIEQAIVASAIDEEPGLPDWRVTGVGVNGQRRRVDDVVAMGDRIELLRPLLADPKADRRRRVERSREQSRGSASTRD